MQNGHVAALSSKHADLEHRIEREMHRPLPDSSLLRRLKSQKLKVKEEIVSLS